MSNGSAVQQSGKTQASQGLSPEEKGEDQGHYQEEIALGKKSKAVFKKCSGCAFKWADRAHFLSDPDVDLVGYQVHFEHLELGLFLFNHRCGSTIALQAKIFTDLYKGPVFKERKTATKECSGYCLRPAELRSCPVQCECAFVRKILNRIKSWKKEGEPSGKFQKGRPA